MKHLTHQERYTISLMYQKGSNYAQIARQLGRYRSTIQREITRNKNSKEQVYDPDSAQESYCLRLLDKRKSIRFTETMRIKLEALLREDYSPEQVSGYLKKQGEDCVCTERIYQQIWDDKAKGGDLYTHLRQKGRKHQKRNRPKT